MSALTAAGRQRPCIAAITFGDKGGGVAAVARLVRRVMRERWPSACDISLLSDRRPTSRRPTGPERLRFGVRLASMQAVGRCDWVFYTHLSVARVQAYLPQPMRRPYAVYLHGVEAWRRLSTGQMSTLRGAALRVANSEFTARRVEMMHPDAGPIAVCPLALPPEPRPTVRPVVSLPVDLGPQAVVLVARMHASERYKGHDELLHAWPIVRAALPAARLVFAGEGDDVPRLKQKAAALGVADTVVFTGFLADDARRALYDRSAIFAMPSRGEGFGLVYLEAMAAGLPCIGSVEDAASEVIEHGRTGFLVEQSDEACLAERVVNLLRDGGLRREMGASGRERVREHFSYEQFSGRLLRVVESVFGAGSAV